MHKVRKHGSGSRVKCVQCGKDIGGKLGMRRHRGRNHEDILRDFGVSAGFWEVGWLI